MFVRVNSLMLMSSINDMALLQVYSWVNFANHKQWVVCDIM